MTNGYGHHAVEEQSEMKSEPSDLSEETQSSGSADGESADSETIAGREEEAE